MLVLSSPWSFKLKLGFSYIINSSIRRRKVWCYRRISWKRLHDNIQRLLTLTMQNLSNLWCLMNTMFTQKKTLPTWLHPACKELALLSQHPWILLHLISCTEQITNKFMFLGKKLEELIKLPATFISRSFF